MQPHSHSHTPDADAPWPPRERSAKRPAKKSSSKKSTAKKSAAKKPAKKSTAQKKSAKTKPTGKKSPAKRPAANASAAKKALGEPRAGAPRAPQKAAKKSSATLAAEVLALLGTPAAEEFLAALRQAVAGDLRGLVEPPELNALERKIAALEHQLAELAPLRRTAEHLEHKLAELANLVAAMSAARFVPGLDTVGEVEEDPCLRWLAAPSIEQYVGQHVALHATRGVIAHADSVAAVIASVRAQGLSLDDVCLATVPALPF